MKFAGKCLLLWLVLMAVQIATGLLAPAVPAATLGEPLTGFQAMAIVNGAYAILMAVLAVHIRLDRISKIIALFVIFYGVSCLMSVIEAVYFNTSLKMSTALLVFMAATPVLTGALVAVAATWLWPVAKPQPMATLGGLGWKVPVIAPIYILFYYGAGAFIAWQSETVRAYYEQGMHINQVELVTLQVVRGLMWAGLAALIVKSLSGSGMFRALMVGISFAIFCTLPLLFPNAVMPWPVRQVHFIEVFISNLLFGWAAGSILLAGRRQSAVPQTA